jgi:hypothetical protein
MVTNEPIPKWVYWMGIGLMLFTVFCFGIMLAGMIYV